MLRIGMVAGEASGDVLGGGLVRALRLRQPNAVVEGIGGARMMAAGCVSHYPMERLSVMGLLETAGRIPELVLQRRRLARRLLSWRPDLFIGIDSPDYNLALERRLRVAGIPTVHYVSPSVWAWRRYRLRRIARSTDLVLTLFPFEAAFYHEHGVPARFVGHPIADGIAMQPDRDAARDALGLPAKAEIVALLPGSRSSEVRLLAGPMLRAARWLAQRRPGLRFVTPLASRETRVLFETAISRLGAELPLARVDGRSLEVLAASDVVLVASGTAALEAMLSKRPMVVTYRLSPLTAWIVARLLTVDLYSLPNLLAGRRLVPELIQDEAVAEKLGAAVLDCLEHPERLSEQLAEFTRLHQVLRRGASERAAEAVLELVGR